MPEARLERITARSSPGCIRRARGWLVGHLRQAGWCERDCRDLGLAFTEACANAARHGYGGRADGRIDVEVLLAGTLARVTVRDRGPGFDPATAEARAVDEPREGGYGLPLIRGLTDEVEFRRERGTMRVTMTKRAMADETAVATNEPSDTGAERAPAGRAACESGHA